MSYSSDGRLDKDLDALGNSIKTEVAKYKGKNFVGNTSRNWGSIVDGLVKAQGAGGQLDIIKKNLGVTEAEAAAIQSIVQGQTAAIQQKLELETKGLANQGAEIQNLINNAAAKYAEREKQAGLDVTKSTAELNRGHEYQARKSGDATLTQAQAEERFKASQSLTKEAMDRMKIRYKMPDGQWAIINGLQYQELEQTKVTTIQGQSMQLSNMMMVGIMKIVDQVLEKFGMKGIFDDFNNGASKSTMNTATSPNGNTQAVAKAVANTAKVDPKDLLKTLNANQEALVKESINKNGQGSAISEQEKRMIDELGLKDGNKIAAKIGKSYGVLNKGDVNQSAVSDKNPANASVFDVKQGRWEVTHLTSKVASIATAPSVVKKTAAVVTEAVTPTKANPEENQPIPLRPLTQLQTQKLG